MSGALAYHAVTHALEAKGGWTPTRRFATSISHALSGHLPYQRHYEAGFTCTREGRGEDAIERLVREQLVLDLNPITVATRSVSQPERVVQAFNSYNEAVNLGARMRIRSAVADHRDHSSVAERLPIAVQDDPAPCQYATYLVFDWLMRQVLINARAQVIPPLARMSEVARYLGLEHSIVREASLALEEQGGIPIPQLARELGCHQRTMERRLREDGLTAEMLRQVARLLRAIEGIRADDNLAMVAADAGFSDQAHMTRVFRASCGMPPSFFKKLMSDKVLPA
jgi:AraC-like DNA-binding protein